MELTVLNKNNTVLNSIYLKKSEGGGERV